MFFIIFIFFLCIAVPYIISLLYPLEKKEDISKEPVIKLLLEDGSIITISLEEYVAGAVIKEMPAEYHIEALKAQAIAIRTYAWLRIAGYSKNHENCDLCYDPSHCQGYSTKEEAYKRWEKNQDVYWNKILRAVEETKGMILTYEGKPIDSVYHANSGGRTESAFDVWGRHVPYLISVDSYWDISDSRLVDIVYITSDEFREIMLGKFNVEIKVDEIVSVMNNRTYTDGNSIGYVDVKGQKIKGTELRAAFSLKSANIYTELLGENVCLITKGRGHGVGMSQYGAGQMAKDGYDYEDILYHYYKDTVIKNIFDIK